MEDHQIIELYWARSESAIEETSSKYGSYCGAIAYRILQDREDTEECVSDTWLKAWNAMPPKRPGKLSAFLGTITRNLALKRWESRSAEKRGGGQVSLALEELEGSIADPADSPEEQAILLDALNRFLSGLSPQARIIFLRRYWYLCPVEEIARMGKMSEGAVKMSLHRSRRALRRQLEKEGFSL